MHTPLPRSLAAALCLSLLSAAAQNPARPRIENDDALVILATSRPGPKGRLHDHKVNRVMIYLEEGEQILEHQDGKVENIRFKAGEVLWSPAAGLHTSQNISAGSFRVVEVELKRPPSPAPRTKPSRLDPVRAAPRNFKVELENDQVRVLRLRLKPGEQTPVVEHTRDLVVVSMANQSIALTHDDGRTETVESKDGDMRFAPAGKVRRTNPGAQPAEEVIVELK
ncbi:MAG: hypothetical protein ACK5AZ_13680 [Bryobacteraceae bacterium]